VKSGDDTFLENSSEVDKQVAAGDEIQIGKGWVLGDVLAGENTHLADGLIDLISPVELDEKSPQALRRNFCNRGCRIKTGPSAVERALADIGGEDLEGHATRCWPGGLLSFQPDVFQHRHGERIDLLSGGAARDPNPYRAGLMVLKQIGEYMLAQRFKGLGVAEETGYMDENIFV